MSLLEKVIIYVASGMVLLGIALGVQQLNQKSLLQDTSLDVLVTIAPEAQTIDSLSDQAIFDVTIQNMSVSDKTFDLQVLPDPIGVGEVMFGDNPISVLAKTASKTTLTLIPGKQIRSASTLKLQLVARDDATHPSRYISNMFELSLNVIMPTIGRQITNSNAHNVEPDIFRDVIVWTQGRVGDKNLSGPNEIYFYNLADPNAVPTIVDNNSSGKGGPAVGINMFSGNLPNQSPNLLDEYRVVYSDNRLRDEENRGVLSTLYTKALTGEGTGNSLCDEKVNSSCPSNGRQMDPAISGNKIVWRDSRYITESGSGYQAIVLYDKGKETILNKPLKGVQTTVVSAPDIDGDKIVWSSNNGSLRNLSDNWHTNTSIISSQIYFVDLSPGSKKRIPFVLYPDENSWQTNPKISGNKIIWQNQVRGSSNVEICLYDLDHPEKGMQMTNSKYPFLLQSYKSHPDISGNYVVWEDNYGALGVSDLFIFDLANSKEYQLNDPGERVGRNINISYHNPVIYGGKIVCERHNGYSQIYEFALNN